MKKTKNFYLFAGIISGLIGISLGVAGFHELYKPDDYNHSFYTLLNVFLYNGLGLCCMIYSLYMQAIYEYEKSLLESPVIEGSLFNGKFKIKDISFLCFILSIISAICYIGFNVYSRFSAGIGIDHYSTKLLSYKIYQVFGVIAISTFIFSLILAIIAESMYKSGKYQKNELV